MGWRPVLNLDFDGVLHLDHGKREYRPEVIQGGPPPGAVGALHEYLESWQVCINSSRFNALAALRVKGGRVAIMGAMTDYLVRVGVARGVIVPFADLQVDNEAYHGKVLLCVTKPSATISIDDRAIRYSGVFPTVQELSRLREEWKRPQ